MLERLDALIVDSDPATREVLECAAASLMRFGEVRPIDRLSQALDSLDNTKRFDLVFVSSRFSAEKLVNFLPEARKTRYGRKSSYVLVLRPGDTSKWLPRPNTGWTYLHAPYTAESIQKIADEVARQRRQERIEADRTHFERLIEELGDLVDRLAELPHSEAAPTRAKLAKLCTPLRSLSARALKTYYEILGERFAKRPGKRRLP